MITPTEYYAGVIRCTWECFEDDAAFAQAIGIDVEQAKALREGEAEPTLDLLEKMVDAYDRETFKGLPESHFK